MLINGSLVSAMFWNDSSYETTGTMYMYHIRWYAPQHVVDQGLLYVLT